MVECALHGCGAQHQGQGACAAHDCATGVDFRHTRQHIRHQINVIKCSGVTRLGQLVICRAVDVIENRPRQARLGQFPEIIDIMTVGKTHDAPFWA